ncbi:alpha/beta fold hydrolase [Roseitranquillus sediminis]|uniref:alpha/beta fold hydrolase n=1 Tax=Roseitranquillus sediminis TaxID=2809051 RepID=UPI001D0C517D|nr:alpha/beta fold hydrolase [Roseitranquillus sediminis]MBM9595938.1 alpha/beta fold hydrolase [Roseitranquillus sediminis]
MTPLTDEMVRVGDGHELCVRSYGTPGRVPVVSLHGGPGSGVQSSHLRIFDPATCHIVAFDQRGAGLSRPQRDRKANTTAHLVADMELLRESFGFSAWLVVGGSWGATLALAYAQAHPERVLGMVLRATFLGTRAELERAFGSGLQTVHPALHFDFLGMLPEAEREDPLPAYWRRILDPDPAVHAPFARAWHDTERILSQLAPANDRLDADAIRAAETPGPASPYMEAHYFSQDCFLDAPLIDGAPRLDGIPGAVVHGRYDLLCPPSTAWALAAAWPDARVRIVEESGHGLDHPALFAAVEAEVARMVARLTSTASG